MGRRNRSVAVTAMALPTRTGGVAALGLPAFLVYGCLLLVPLGMLFAESLRLFEPGYVGARAGAPLTLQNYAELTSGAFMTSLLVTLRIGLLASLAGVALALPLAWLQARALPRPVARALLMLLIVLMFLGVLVRTYAVQLLLGPTGPLRPLLEAAGIAANGRAYIEFCVAAGLLHYIIPLSALTLIPTIHALDPRLTEAALSLGANRFAAHRTITFPLCAAGLGAAFILSLTFSISAFVIPMVLGRGRVNFVSSLVYTRFSEIANYPSGSAISIALLALSVCFVTLLALLLRRWGESAGAR